MNPSKLYTKNGVNPNGVNPTQHEMELPRFCGHVPLFSPLLLNNLLLPFHWYETNLDQFGNSIVRDIA